MVAKMTANFAKVWHFMFEISNTDEDKPHSLFVDGSGTYMAGISSSTPTRGFFARLDPDGLPDFGITYRAASGNISILAMCKIADGNFMLVGST